MIGKILVYITFSSFLFATLSYFYAMFSKKEDLIKFGRLAFYFGTASIIATTLFLLSKILAHDFQFTYVWEYSSRELQTYFLIATFYAGQQGSFLLWGLWTAIIGFIIIPYLQKHKYEAPAMSFYALAISFIVFILIVKSPFDYVWETYVGQVVEGFTPKNGRGLNPILQNYWITIHPPILFLGFASLTVPFALAMAALINKDFKNWINITIPWTLFASGILALGLMLGGFWAYETLGWGGFWAWDPVENSSLMPWIISAALVHTMLVTKRTGGLVKTSFTLAILGYIFVLYSSFLTRSGVLGETSVHSFVSPGAVVYQLLLTFLLVFVVISTITLFLRLNGISTSKIDFSVESREFYISLGSVTLLVIGFVVFLGTSFPIIADLINQIDRGIRPHTGVIEDFIKKGTVETAWYNNQVLPIAVIMTLLNAWSLLYSWRKTVTKDAISKSILSLIFSIIIAALAVYFGIKDFKFIALFWASAFSLAINFKFIFSSISKNYKLTGGFLSHFGLAIFTIGAITSGGYSIKKQIRLVENQTKTFEGYKLTYLKKEQIQKELGDREKYQYTIQVEKDGHKANVYPIVYWSDFNQRQAPFFEPGISSYFAKDVYVSPFSIEPFYEKPPALLSKNSIQKISMDSSISIELVKFDMRGMMAAAGGGQMKPGAIVKFVGKDFEKTDTLYAIMDPQSGTNMPFWDTIAHTNIEAGFIQLIPNRESLGSSQAVIAFKEVGKSLEVPKDIFTFEASLKPFILLVWIGTILLVLGFFISIAKYSANSKKISKALEEIEATD